MQKNESEKLNKLISMGASMEARMASMEGEMASMGSKITSMGSRLDTLENQVTAFGAGRSVGSVQVFANTVPDGNSISRPSTVWHNEADYYRKL